MGNPGEVSTGSEGDIWIELPCPEADVAEVTQQSSYGSCPVIVIDRKVPFAWTLAADGADSILGCE